jgi:Ca2+-binding RTX toxin-like protein
LNTGTIEGSSFYVIIGGAGADRVINQGTISGGINLGAGNNYYDGRGGTHNGYIKPGFSSEIGHIWFGNDNDTAYGGNGPENFVALDGNDFLSGGGGNDIFSLGEGDDVAIGGSGDDLFDLGVPGFGIDTINGGDGVDTVTLATNILLDAVIDLRSTKLQLVDAQWGKVQLSGIENVISAKGDDLLIGSKASNELVANEGSDTLDGGLGNDVLDGGDGFDYARFTGSIGAKVNLTKTSAQVTGYGTDTFKGIEALIGGTGGDSFIGDGNFNVLFGNAGNDTLSGGGGSDSLYSGIGNDKLTGGAQSDLFFFDTALNAKTNVDTITDFTRVDDTFQLDNAIFNKLTKVGTLNKSYFAVSSKAKDKNDYIVYDKVKGALYYDADGSGKGVAILFAKIKKGTVIDHNDFFVM